MINLLLQFSQNMGYWGIVFLMIIESSFIPFPSEIVIPPAAYLAHQGEMNIFLIILSGTIGSVIGALINYFLARTLGRKIIYSLSGHKLLKLFLINEKKIAYAENYFLKYSGASTLFGRFVPALRQLISLPAGFSKMNLKKFILYTGLGSGMWVTILAILGYALDANQQLLSKNYKEISLFFIAVIALIIMWIIVAKYTKRA
ncbi:DedA family protein [Patescibacteria group bacterium]|nr:DedA family protein [Patescibacteria group bacterium]